MVFRRLDLTLVLGITLTVKAAGAAQNMSRGPEFDVGQLGDEELKSSHVQAM